MELELKVEGMTCTGCSTRVAEALKVLLHAPRYPEADSCTSAMLSN